MPLPTVVRGNYFVELVSWRVRMAISAIFMTRTSGPLDKGEPSYLFGLVAHVIEKDGNF
jgi:hypothetical protein